MLHRRSFLAQTLGGLAAGPLAASIVRADVAEEPSRQLGEILERVRVKHSLPSMAAVAVRDGNILAVNAVGVRKLGDPTPVTVDDKFHLGSCTKSMTATLAAIFIEQGKLDWQTTIEDVLGTGIPNIDPALRKIPLIQLLCHWSGITTRNSPKDSTLGQLYSRGTLKGPPREQRRRFCRLILAEPPETPPGTQFAYSNLNYTIAGHMLETVANQEWESLLTERIAVPLKMTSVGFGAMGRPGQIAQPWQHRIVDDKPTPIEPGPNSDNPAVLGPGGTAHMTPADWGRYLIAHVDGEQGLAPLLKPETWRKLHQPPYKGEQALGWFQVRRAWGGPEGRVYNHSGTNNQNYAIVWMAPERRLAVGVLTNQGGDAARDSMDGVASGVIREIFRL